MQTCDVAIIGAGPYGLAAAAHLSAIGAEYRIFGGVMRFWREQMPIGMVLRSERDGTNISHPARTYGLGVYEQDVGAKLGARIPLDEFVRYGEWFQRRAVPSVDARNVRLVEATANGYVLTLEDGEPLTARRVVVATGLAAFPRRPAVFAEISRDLVSHTCEERDLGRFGGRRVLVVGAGQSALESAALLGERGAEVEVVTRRPLIHWLGQMGDLSRSSGRWAHILYPPGAVGPPGINWIVELPDLFRSLPAALQTRVAARALRPAGSGWLVPRVTGVAFTAGREITGATPESDALRLTLSDGSERSIDHVLLGTGYHVDVMRYPFLSPELARRVEQRGGEPVLGAGFESSVPGLHFLGAASAHSYGPLMRFVAGTGYAGRALARRFRSELPAAQTATVAEAGVAD
jgi:hypothetical protein